MRFTAHIVFGITATNAVNDTCREDNLKPQCSDFNNQEDVKIEGSEKCKNTDELPVCRNSDGKRTDMVEGTLTPDCRDADDNGEKPLCDDENGNTKDFEFIYENNKGEYLCPLGGFAPKMCGDGIVSNVVREAAGICYDPQGNDEAIRCGDDKVAQIRVTTGPGIGKWSCPNDNMVVLVCSDGVLPGVIREAAPQCYKADNATDDEPKCEGVALTRGEQTGKWQECPENLKGVCGDGLNFGIDRSSLPEHDECKDADNADEVPTCGAAEGKQTRDFSTGKWVACTNTARICGDGLNPGVDRGVLAKFPHDECKDADNADEVPTCGEIDGKQYRDPGTGEWNACNNTAKPCGDGINPGVDRSSLPAHAECKTSKNADQVPLCQVEGSTPINQKRDPTGVWEKCGGTLAAYASCSDGLNPGVDRGLLDSEKHEVCKDRDNADQIPMCVTDNIQQTRDPTNAKWQACDGGYQACDDGLLPGIDRSVLDSEKHDTCKNKAGDKEEVPTCFVSLDSPEVAITRDSTSGVWSKCPNDKAVNACGDGFNPGVDRTEPEKPVCLDKDEVPEAQMCEYDEKDATDDEAMVRGADGKWGCPYQFSFKACGDGLNPGVDRADPEALKCFDADNETPEKPQCIEQPGPFGDIIRLPTGPWGCKESLTGGRYEFKPCGDGLHPGVDRGVLAKFTQDVCKDADNADEVPTCGGDEGKQERDPETGKWIACKQTPKPCGDGLMPTVERGTKLADNPALVCKDGNADDETPTCDDGSSMIRSPTTGVWGCPAEAAMKVCGDGLNPGVDRRLLAEYTQDVCKDADGADEVPTCGGDEGKQGRDPGSGEWVACTKPAKPCGDGLNPTVSRDLLAQEKHETCKNKAGDADEIPTCGRNFDEITRDPTNGKWIKCKDSVQQNPVNPCGDGLNPAVDRQVFIDNPQDICQDDKGASQVPKCPLGDQKRNANSGEWVACVNNNEKVKATCGDGLYPGTSRDKKRPICKNEAGDADEDVKCGGSGKDRQSRNKETGEWECGNPDIGADGPWKCTDGMYPGVSRTEPTGICRDADKKDEAITCGEDNMGKQVQNSKTGVWECPENQAVQPCSDGYEAGDIENRLEPGVCSDESEVVCKDGAPLCKDGEAATDGKCTEGNALYCNDPEWEDGPLIRAECANGKISGGHQEENKKMEKDRIAKEEKEAEERKDSIEKSELAAKLFAEVTEASDAADEAGYKTAHASYKESKDAFDATSKDLEGRYEAEAAVTKTSVEAINRKFKARPEVAKANGSGTSESNVLRLAMGQQPLRVSVEDAQRAQSALDDWTCVDKDGAEVDVKVAVECKPPAKKADRRLEVSEDDCAVNTWTNPEFPGTESTAEDAVKAWYAQGEFYDAKTGAMTEGKTEEATEYINVINRDTTRVGFAIRGPTVLGYYCPPAVLTAESLLETVAKVREAPLPPVAPEGVELLDTEDAPCPVLSGSGTEEDPEIRAACSNLLCCGESKGTETEPFSSCRDSSKTEFEGEDGEKFTFSCYLEDARKLAMSLSAIAAAVAFYV